MVTDPRADHQPLTEASYVNLTIIALCHTDSPLSFVDIANLATTRGLLSGSDVLPAGPRKCYTCVAPSPVNTHGTSCLISTSTEILTTMKRKSRPLLKSP